MIENEKRLIDAEAVKRLICETCNKIYGDERCKPSECFCMNLIDKVPEEDAVVVVWCEDCDHLRHTEDGGTYCAITWSDVDNDDFCSYGRRKDDG